MKNALPSLEFEVDLIPGVGSQQASEVMILDTFPQAVIVGNVVPIYAPNRPSFKGCLHNYRPRIPPYSPNQDLTKRKNPKYWPRVTIVPLADQNAHLFLRPTNLCE